MNDQFYPDEEKRLARDIDKALRPLDDEPSARIAPESIVSRLREEQAPTLSPFTGRSDGSPCCPPWPPAWR